MKKTIFLILLIMAAAVSCASAVIFEINFTGNDQYMPRSTFSNIKVDQLRYEPYPVNPDEYFTVWIKAENYGRTDVKDAIFELAPKFPFSLDPNENPGRDLGKLSGAQAVVFQYKVRVDKNAVAGENKLDLKYKTNPDDTSWYYESFDISVEEAQTDFDLVIQDVSNNQVSIAIANTGKNPAYSVIVRVPEQDAFQTTGTSGQMVGNLANGDYTLVSFEISEKKANVPLKIQIDYTDTIGERRSVVKELDFNTGQVQSSTQVQSTQSANRTNGQNFSRNGTAQLKIYQQWWFWAIIIVLGYGVFRLYKFYKKRKEESYERKPKK
jgi:hypothetical protein